MCRVHSDLFSGHARTTARPNFGVFAKKGSEKSEVFRLWCDNTRIHALTGFRPEYDIRRGMQATIDWFTQPHNLAKYKADIYNV